MHPYLQLTDSIAVPLYGIAMAVGFLAAVVLVRRLAPRAGLDPERVTEVAVWLVLGGLIGSRVAYVLTSGPVGDESQWELLLPWRAGHVWYGGFLGGVAALALLRNRLGGGLPDFADVCAPGVALGHAFGRLGCLAAGCCWGREASLPWSVVFPEGGACPLPGSPLHPTQIYEAGGEAVICLLLLAVWKRRRFSGQIFLAYLLLYAVLRFTVELFRGDTAPGLGPLTLAQTTAAALAAVAVATWVAAAWRRRGAGREDRT